MPESAFEVRVHKADYPAPALGDREVDEELGPIIITSIADEGDQWAISYGPERPAIGARRD